MTNAGELYGGREQTRAKHFILERYLQALAFKTLGFWDLAYVDGFSGPWETRDDSFADSSFKIALDVLRNAQRRVLKFKGERRRVRCFFSEIDPVAYAQLDAAVRPYHRPAEDFEVRTFCGRFEDAVAEIQAFVGHSFPLIFIDPTGWTGYPLDKIKPLFARPKVEVLVNFMFDHISRFSADDRPEIKRSFDPILGGPGWRTRFDPNFPVGIAAENLFRENLRAAGDFSYLVSTRIDKATSDRPQFSIIYGTKDVAGLKAFRDAEYAAQRKHAGDRVRAKDRRAVELTGQLNFLLDHEAGRQEASIDDQVAEQVSLARTKLLEILERESSLRFSKVVAKLIEPFRLRATDVKNICVGMAAEGLIENTWGRSPRKPRDDDVIMLRTR
jgi:three-Cys-motif partner protein